MLLETLCIKSTVRACNVALISLKYYLLFGLCKVKWWYSDGYGDRRHKFHLDTSASELFVVMRSCKMKSEPSVRATVNPIGAQHLLLNNNPKSVGLVHVIVCD